jgi:hypothetical protein
MVVPDTRRWHKSHSTRCRHCLQPDLM